MPGYLYYSPPGSSINSFDIYSTVASQEITDQGIACQTSEQLLLLGQLFNVDPHNLEVAAYRAKRKLPLRILLDWSYEDGIDDQSINDMLSRYTEVGVDLNHILVTLNDSQIIPNRYQSVNCQVVLIDRFEFSAWHRCFNLQHPISTVAVKDRPLMINLLLGKLKKPLRAEIPYQFYRQKLIEKSIISLLGDQRELRTILKAQDEEFYSVILKCLKSVDGIGTIETSDGTSANGWSGSAKVYDQSSVSYICETHDNISYENKAKPAFRTEKTYRPIINRHPFVIQATSGFLESLHAKGFKTFSNFIDESYDKYTICGPTRVSDLVSKSAELLDVVAKHPAEIQDIVNFNFNQLCINVTSEYDKFVKTLEKFLK
jgi:hypothetical protein